MALDDWNQKKGSTEMGLSSQRVYEGSKSFKFHDGGSEKIIILQQSESDTPTEAQIATMINFNTTYNWNNDFGAVFRYQDLENYYALVLDMDDAVLQLMKMKSNSHTQISSSNFYSSINEGKFQKHRFTCWKTDDGVLHFRWEADTGNGLKQNADDLQDPNNDLTSGGGVGMVHGYNGSSTDAVWIDNTEIRY